MTTLNKINISKNAESIIEDYHAPEFVSEVVTVRNNILNLTEVPSEDYSVEIEDFTEVTDFDLLVSNTVDDLFYVNYKQGYIVLNKEHSFEKITVNYYGIGKSYLSAFRVYVGTDSTGNVAETLGDLFKGGENVIEALDVYGGYATMILRIDSTTEECNTLLNKIDRKLSQLSTTDCQATTVTSTNWTSSSDGIYSYEYSIIHNLQSTNILCEFENSAGVSINDGSVKYKVISNNKIKVYSNSKLPVKVKYMARYYNGLDSTNASNIRQEIEDARLNPTYDEAFSSVKENINYVSEQIKTLNDKYENRFSDNVKVTYRGGEEIVITNSTQMILLGAYEASELYKITGSGIYEGKRITLIFYNSMTTVKNSGNLNSIVKDGIILSKLLDTSPVANCTIDLIRINGGWIETSRNY